MKCVESKESQDNSSRYLFSTILYLSKTLESNLGARRQRTFIGLLLHLPKGLDLRMMGSRYHHRGVGGFSHSHSYACETQPAWSVSNFPPKYFRAKWRKKEEIINAKIKDKIKNFHDEIKQSAIIFEKASLTLERYRTIYPPRSATSIGFNKSLSTTSTKFDEN